MAIRKKIILEHVLVPKHEIVAEEEVPQILERLGIDSTSKLPKILEKDPVARAIGAKRGQVVRIYRKDPTGEYEYYRVVV